ncbi:MAG: 16S rRNA (guanine(527)-N(7))-methyltransferase RsmG [Erysipelotrichaceae bacterium]|nr:16S rRNA (guanine(527)-N(7))-methyltransferase RsmG [Erysipelotrichaceae bacterium]
MTETEFQKACSLRGLELNGEQLAKFRKYTSFLVAENEKMNLTAITDEAEIYLKHYYDSLIFTYDIDFQGSVLDVGTGAGFPGVVLKIAYPQIRLTLLDSLGKRCRFLEELCALLEFENTEVVNARGEEYAAKHREEYDWVTARAVAPLPILLEICAAAVKTGGCFVALRGAKGTEEITEAEYAAARLGLELESVREENYEDNTRIIAFYRKKKKTEKRYPRRFGEIKKEYEKRRND